MAAVVTTYTVNSKQVFGSKRVHDVTLAFDTGDYAASGIAITAAGCGLNAIDSVMFQGACLDVAATPSALMPRWVPTTTVGSAGGKVQLWECAGAGASMTEKPAEAMGAGATVRIIAIGH